jgi:hypothetical protein
MEEPQGSAASKILSVALGIIHAAGVAVLLFAVAYVFGNSILSGRLQGSDSPLHLAYALWLDQYFPHIPHWYPLQGAGASILHGYPLLAHLMVVALHRASGLSILQAFRLVTFAAFPLTAFGVYLLGWSLFGRKTIGLIASLFFLASPVTWTWMYNWGFFAQQVGLVFLPPALIAFDRTLRHQLGKGRSGRGRLWFTLLIVLLVIGSLCHMLVAAAAVLGFLLLSLFAALSSPASSRVATLRGAIKVIVLIGVVSGLLVAAYFVPFFEYGQVANREGLNTPPASQLHRLPILQFFGLKPIDPLEILTRMQFPILVVGFAVLGILASVVFTRRKIPGGSKALAISLTLLLSVVLTLSPGLIAIILRLSPFLVQFVNFRSALILAMILMPVCGAYGAWALAWALFHPHALMGIGPPALEHGGVLRSASARVGVSIVAMLIVCAFILPAGRFAATRAGSLSYGPLEDGIDLRDIWNAGIVDSGQSPLEQLALQNWPSPILSDTDEKISESMALASKLPSDRPLRIDVSPYQGRLAMDLATYANVSQINAYTYTTSLEHAMWGYQQNVFYSKETPVNEYGNPRTLNGLAEWFGTRYVFLNSDQDPVETYQAAGWDKTYEDGTLQIWHDPSAPDMATVTTRPTVLVIGTAKSDAYMTIFRMANDGMLPYDQALLVEGRPEVDSYSADELSAFDAVFLYGYDYRNGRKAWDTLATYVKQGGSLFVDTGWEYWIPEWQFEDAPDVLPVDRLTWTDYGPATTYELGEPEISGNVDVTKFKPLIWEGNPWTLSGADASDVRDWGRVVLSTGGRPLIVAGNYGQGKVVWSGMNLIGHARYGDPNAEEITFLGNIVRWLAGVGSGTDMQTPIMSRPDPDHVDLSFTAVPGDVTWLYWRESYYPDWHAYLTDSSGERDIPIYRSGPGLMLMPVKSDSDVVSVRLAWVPSWTEQAAIVLSVLGVLLLGAFFVDGLFLAGNGFTWLRIALTMRMPSPILDEEANLEVAEAQKADLERRRKGIRFGRGHATRSAHHSQARGEARQPQAGKPTVAGSAHVPAPDDKLDAAQEALFQSWLESTGHADDAWASRLIGRKQNQVGPRSGREH